MKLYIGTTKTFYNHQIKKYGRYTLKISLLDRLFKNKQYKWWNQKGNLFLSSNPNDALKYSLTRAIEFNYVPIILIVKSEDIEKANMKIKKGFNPDEYYIKKGKLSRGIIKIVEFNSIDEAQKLLFSHRLIDYIENKSETPKM